MVAVSRIDVDAAHEAVRRRGAVKARPGHGAGRLGVLLAILGSVVLFTSLTIEVEGGDKIGAWAWRPLGIIVLSVALFGVLIPRLGMFIALPILIVVSASASSEFHWKDALINAVVLTAFSWVIFIYGLKLTIPLWPTFLG